MTDVAVVSSVLPYCDAILVDREVRSLTELGPVGERLGFETRAFSKGTMPGMLEYLEDVEHQAPRDVIEVAAGLYGQPEPYLTIFDDRSGE